MADGWKWQGVLIGAGGVVGTVLIAATQVSASQATSNLASWANLLGLSTLGEALRGHRFDQWGMFVGVVLLGASLAAFGWHLWQGQNGQQSEPQILNPAVASLGSGALTPDWTIRQLFLHICPDVVADEFVRYQPSPWDDVARQILDRFSTGQMNVWGREEDKVTKLRHNLEAIRAEYWPHVRFCYGFLDPATSDLYQTYSDDVAAPRYADLHVNKAQAKAFSWRDPNAARRNLTPTRPAPYRQHVLEMDKPVSSRLRGADGELENSQTEINIRNISRVDLKKCCVAVLTISDGMVDDAVDTFIGGTRKSDNKTLTPYFALPRGGQRRIILVRRDLKDLVSKPPHLLALGSGKYVLYDNKIYILKIELRSESDTPTKITMQIDVGEREVLTATILDQSV